MERAKFDAHPKKVCHLSKDEKSHKNGRNTSLAVFGVRKSSALIFCMFDSSPVKGLSSVLKDYFDHRPSKDAKKRGARPLSSAIKSFDLINYKLSIAFAFYRGAIQSKIAKN